MFQHLIYKCPKCQNTLLVSNKMLHDLRCTEENPATYENVLRQSQIMNSISLPQNSLNGFQDGLRKSNLDGTSSDIKRNINFNGEEEYIETKYDAEGNIISRKRADNFEYNLPQNNNYEEVSEFNEYEEEDNNYVNNPIQNNIYIEPTVGINNAQEILYETAQPQEIVYEAPAKYDPNITINQPIQETIISSDINLSDNVMNDIIRHSIRLTGNNNINLQINNGNVDNIMGNINNINNIPNFSDSNTDIINNIFNGSLNQNLNFDNNNIFNQGTDFNNINSIDNSGIINLNMNADDVLRRTAGVGSHNYTNNNINYPF